LRPSPADVARAGELRESELRLQKEIESVRREIEVVRKEAVESELRLRKEIEQVRLEIGALESRRVWPRDNVVTVECAA